MGFVDSALMELIKQGTGYLLFALAGAWCYVLDGRLKAEQAANDLVVEKSNKAVQEQYEKRLAEFREILDAMTSSTASINTLTGSLKPVTDAINQMVVGLAQLLASEQAQQVRWDDMRGNVMRQLEDLRVRLETLQREARAA